METTVFMTIGALAGALIATIVAHSQRKTLSNRIEALKLEMKDATNTMLKERQKDFTDNNNT